MILTTYFILTNIDLIQALILVILFLGLNRITAIGPGKNVKKTILYGPCDRNGALSHFGDQTRGESPTRTSTRRPLHEFEPKTNLWRYFAEPLRLRLPADRWRRYTPVAVILLKLDLFVI